MEPGWNRGWLGVGLVGAMVGAGKRKGNWFYGMEVGQLWY